jgi:SAM-dependent MidA family methyltransferase
MWARVYGPSGYYKNGNGVNKDFATYVSIDDHLSIRLAQWLDDEWERLGQPDTFPVYEYAAGDGTLCRKILSQDLRCRDTIRYTAVESNPLYGDKFPAGVTVTQQLEEPPTFGVIFANELLGAIPIRFVGFRDGGWQELYVRVNETTQASYEWRPFDGHPTPSMVEAAEEGRSMPYMEQPCELLRNIASQLTGTLLTIDYGKVTTKELYGTPWFRCYREYRPAPALKLDWLVDMTYDITVDQISDLFMAPTSVITQPEWVGKSDHDSAFKVLEWRLQNGKRDFGNNTNV